MLGISNSKWKEVSRCPKFADGFFVEIILVHDIRKGHDSEIRLERFVSEVCSIAGKETGIVSHRVHAYRVDPDRLRGNGGLDAGYGAFVARMEETLAKTTSPPGSRVIFIAYELGAWVVRNLLQDDSYGYGSDEGPDDHTSPFPPLVKVIFLGAEERQGFQPLTYLTERLAWVQKLDGTSKDQFLHRFTEKLRSIDSNFEKALHKERTVLAENTWLLPAPDLTLPTSTLIKPLVGKEDGPNLGQTLLSRLALRRQSKSRSMDTQACDIKEQTREFGDKVLQHLTLTTSPSREAQRYIDISKVLEKHTKDSEPTSIDRSVTGSSHSATTQAGSLGVKAIPTKDPIPELSSHMSPSTATPLSAPPQKDSRQHNQDHASFDDTEYGDPTYLRVVPPTQSIRANSTYYSESPQDGYFPFQHDTLNSQSSQQPPSSPNRRKKRVSVSSKIGEDVSNSEDRVYLKLSQRMEIFRNPALQGSDLVMFYRDCIALLKGFTAKNVGIEALSYRLQARRAVLDSGDGKYSDKTARDTLHQILRKLEDKFNLADVHQEIMTAEPAEVRYEIMYRLAAVNTRLGEYDMAYDSLTYLQREEWFRSTENLLSTPQNILPTQYNDPRIDATVNINRLLALLCGYYGHFTLAFQHIEKAETQFSDLLCARKTGVSPLATPNPFPVVPTPTPFHPDPTPYTLDITPQPRTSTLRAMPQIPINTTVLHIKIQLAKVKLAMLQGDEPSALALINPVLRRLENPRHFGGGHILTLEAVSLRALILCRMFDPEAETVCNATLEATTTHLADDHPLAMEALSTLADVLLTRSRPYEVLDTVFYLRSRARDKLGECHPQTMRYWFQVGEANLSVGNYAKARTEFQAVYMVASKKWEKETSQGGLGRHPDVPRYLARLAIAKCFLEKLDEAEDDAYKALRWQLEIFRPEIEIEGEGLESDLAMVVSELERNTADAQVDLPHPNLLESLMICSMILDRRNPATGHDLRTRILTLVGKKRAVRYTNAHHLTLATNLELAFSRLEEGDDGGNPHDLDQTTVAELFERISLDCERSLGPNHILTWRARLGRLFTSSNIDPLLEAAKFRQEASNNINEQIVLMGGWHPLVLDSRWRLFVFKLLVYPDEDAHESGSQLLDSLRLKEIRQERLMESLQLEEKVARIYAVELVDYEHGLPIINDILEYCDTVPWEEEFCDNMEAFSRRVCDLLELAVEQTFKELDEEKNQNNEAAVLALPRFLEFAKELRTTYEDNIHNRIAGLLVLGRLLQQAFRSTEHDSPEWLYDKITAAFQKWKQSLVSPESNHKWYGRGGSVWARAKAKGKSKGKGKGERKAKNRIEREDLERGW